MQYMNTKTSDAVIDGDIGYEARAGAKDPHSIRLWLRMMTCTKQIEDEIRRRLREKFDISIARFDYMAQLYRYPDGLKMSELSRFLMVTGGNITGLTDELANEGLVTRESSKTDRRAWMLMLTDKGKSSFEEIATEHNQWVHDLFEGLSQDVIEDVYQQLGWLRRHISQVTDLYRSSSLLNLK